MCKIYIHLFPRTSADPGTARSQPHEMIYTIKHSMTFPERLKHHGDLLIIFKSKRSEVGGFFFPKTHPQMDFKEYQSLVTFHPLITLHHHMSNAWD